MDPAGEQPQQPQQGAAAESPAARLRQLEQQAAALAAQRREVRAQLADAAVQAVAAAAARRGGASTGVPLPEDPAAIVGELAVLHTVKQYLLYLQDLHALARQLDKAARAAEMERPDSGEDPASFFSIASEAVDAFSRAMGYVAAVEQLLAGGNMPSATKLLQMGGALAGRVQHAGSRLRALLSAAVQERLRQCAWPPLLSATADDDAPAGRDGFAAADAAAVGELQNMFVVLLTLQRATQFAAFTALEAADPADPGPGGAVPVLWPAEELAVGAAERLHYHFAQGLPTDRADKPEWLFAAALKAGRQCGAAAEVFQPAVEAHGLQERCSMQLEVARALHAVGVLPLLRDHVLPRLAAGSDPPAWLHYADEAMRYERRYAPLRGAPAAAADQDDDDGATAAAHAASAVEVLFEEESWREGWLGAELWDAQRQVEAACEAPGAWLPSPSLSLGQLQAALDLGGGGKSTAGLHVASQHEFYPPACAEATVALAASLVRRGGWMSAPAHYLRYLKAVPQAALKAFRSRLSGLLSTAEQFNDMLGEAWLPRVGAAVCAAHYVEHQLREPQGALLAARGGGGEGAAALAALLHREAAALGALRRQWAYKLAKAAVDQFQAAFAAYKRELSAFTAGFDDPGAGRDQPPAPPAGPSLRLLPAAESLQRTLRALSSHLDAVAFRDVWRAAALAVNYAFFNDVATEAAVGAQGALQLDADCQALLAVFAQCTLRPAAHFKESREACALLLLGRAEAAELAGALGSGHSGALAACGVRALNAEQAAAVLERRLDLSGCVQGS